VTFTIEDFIKAFTEWDRRYREEPEQFSEEWHELFDAETYGEQAAAYFVKLLKGD
jgi:hypothetical protein